jgi:hypothetical protein
MAGSASVSERRRGRAVVLGGSLAGPLAARALSETYRDVVVSSATNSAPR